mmetsp:Transcript_22939/g.43844  ORF Transcript_22939/g.43844 Transcript_22939/m.43844 type:complete len:487 (+) Transcript_22939:514-1974(+)
MYTFEVGIRVWDSCSRTDSASLKVDLCSAAALVISPCFSVASCSIFSLACASSNPRVSKEHPLAILRSSTSCTTLVAALSLLRTMRALAEVAQRDGGVGSGQWGTGEKNARTTEACSVNTRIKAPPSLARAMTCKGVVPSLLVTAVRPPTHGSMLRVRRSTSTTAASPRTVASCKRLPWRSTSLFGASISGALLRFRSRSLSTTGMEQRTAARVAASHTAEGGAGGPARSYSRHAPSCTSAPLSAAGASLASMPATSLATSALGLSSRGAATRCPMCSTSTSARLGSSISGIAGRVTSSVRQPPGPEGTRLTVHGSAWLSARQRTAAPSGHAPERRTWLAAWVYTQHPAARSSRTQCTCGVGGSSTISPECTMHAAPNAVTLQFSLRAKKRPAGPRPAMSFCARRRGPPRASSCAAAASSTTCTRRSTHPGCMVLRTQCGADCIHACRLARMSLGRSPGWLLISLSISDVIACVFDTVDENCCGWP